ncbi:MAG: cobalamin-dependent protein [Desulfamplus sp.]|nr:cobalamin-dependent protein [Desulfamplus sp.]
MKMDTPHILCVNPWIHDFAAFDFWAKPLGLLQIAAIIRAGGARVTFIDCLDRFHVNALEEGPVKVLEDGRGPFRKRIIPLPPAIALEIKGKRFSRYGIEPEWFRQDLRKLKAKNRPDLILVTSLMTYWASGVRETIALIKEVFPLTPVVLGGIYATLCREHAQKHSLADQVISGGAEGRIGSIVMEHTGFGLSGTAGVSSLYAPHLDDLPIPALDICKKLPYVPILTSRGCPFSCDYCASSLLEPHFRRRSWISVFQEISHWHNNYGVKNFAFYDDALLVDSEKHILPLLDAIVASPFSSRTAFHTPNALHIRYISREIAGMMFRAGFRTIRLGLETMDFSKCRKGDTKVVENEFHHAVAMLREAGFLREQIGAYLLCALPGQNLDHLAHSISLVKKSGIVPVLAYYSPIPNTPMWQDAVRCSRFDLENDPLLTNNALLPCLGDSREIKKILELKKLAQQF